MPSIIIRNLNNKEIEFSSAKNVLKILHGAHQDWMHSCGAKGRCTTCKMTVLEGAENLSMLSHFEEKMKNVGKLANEERLACQTVANGDIVIMAPQEYKLPHLSYSD